MNPLEAEFHRLYLVDDATAVAPSLMTLDGRVRAMVMELARPADWSVVSTVWQRVYLVLVKELMMVVQEQLVFLLMVYLLTKNLTSDFYLLRIVCNTQGNFLLVDLPYLLLPFLLRLKLQVVKH